jgi:hypothetical protein
MQLVIATEIIDAHAGPPNILAVYVW